VLQIATNLPRRRRHSNTIFATRPTVPTMAAKADASQYGIPLEWVASKGELGKHADPGSISKSERLILYNQDVLYHQNKEILQALAK